MGLMMYEVMQIKDWLLKEEKAEVFLVSDISKHGCSGGVCGIIYYNELFDLDKLIGFILIWIAVIIYLRDLYINKK